MIHSEEDNILITRFFDFDLSEKELLIFEERLAKDIGFEKKFQTYVNAQKSVNDSFAFPEEKLRQQQWKTILHTEEKNSNTPWKWIGSIAAGFILVFSIWQGSSSFQKSNMDQLIADSWNKKIGLDVNLTRGESLDSLKQQINTAYDLYNRKKYEAVVGLFNRYAFSAVYYEDALLLKGLSNYKIGNTEIALKTLDTLASYRTGKKAKVAQWYQGLIYLEQGNIKTASEFLKLPDDTNGEIKLKE